MKALIITPTFSPKLTGNAATVGRITLELAEGGIECRVIDLSTVTEAEAIKIAKKFRPDLIHGFHAFKSGCIGLLLMDLLKIPMITTLTGTDLHVNLRTSETRDLVRRVLTQADRVTVFNDAARRLLIRNHVAPEKISVIHQSVFFPEQKERDLRTELHISSTTTVFLLIGGIRRVKNFGYSFPVFDKVRKSFPDLCLLIAGGVLEEGEFLRLTRKSTRRPWIRFLGEISRKEIPSLLRCTDVVLNTSDSESETNAIMEAMSLGKTVVGRRISGNTSLLSEQTGFLFSKREELYEQILHILRNKREAMVIGRQAELFIAVRFSRDLEQENYLRLYRETTNKNKMIASTVSQ